MHGYEIIGGIAEGMIMKMSDSLEHSIPSLQTWSVNNPNFYKDMHIINNIANFKETTNSYVCDDDYDAGF